MTHNSIDLTAAFASIADALTDMKKVQDKSTGEEVVINQMAYAQRRVMNGIAYSIELSLSSTRQSIEKAARELQVATRSFRADELSIQKLDKATSWIERLQMQEAVLDDAFAAATLAYETATGEVYVDAETQKRNREAAKTVVSTNPHLARAQALLATVGKAGARTAMPGHDSAVNSSDPAEQAA